MWKSPCYTTHHATGGFSLKEGSSYWETTQIQEKHHFFGKENLPHPQLKSCVFSGLPNNPNKTWPPPFFTAAFHRPATHRRCGRNLRGPRNASQGDQRGDMFWMSSSPAVEENPKSSRMEGFLFESLIKFGCPEHKKGGWFFSSLMWNTVRFNLILLRSPV